MFFVGYALGIATIFFILNLVDRDTRIGRWIPVFVLIILAILNLLKEGGYLG